MQFRQKKNKRRKRPDASEASRPASKTTEDDCQSKKGWIEFLPHYNRFRSLGLLADREASDTSGPFLHLSNMYVLNFTASTTRSKYGTICQSCPKFYYFYWHNLSKVSPIWLFLLQSQNLAQIVKIVFNFTAPTTKSKSGTICQNCFQFYSSHYKVQIWHNLPKLSSILP